MAASCCDCKHKSFNIRDGKIFKTSKPSSKDTSVEDDKCSFRLSGRNGVQKKNNESRSTKQSRKKIWIPDSGATVTTCNRLEMFEYITDYYPDTRIQVADGQFVKPIAIGCIKLQLKDTKGKQHTLLLQDVYYMPEFPVNLLSIRQLYDQHKIKTTFGNSCKLRTANGTKFKLSAKEDKFYSVNAFAAIKVDGALWHRRFMHASMHSLRCLPEYIRKQFGDFDSTACHDCIQGGAKRKHHGDIIRRRVHEASKKHTRNKRKFTFFGERISSDLCGPFPKSIDGDLYAIVFHDSATKYVAVYTLPDKTKETVLAAFQQFIHDHSHELTKGVVQFHTDNGGEYINSDMDAFCEEICVKRSFTVPYNSAQNPYAERSWGDLLRKVRTSLVASGTEESYWHYAIKHAALIHNIIPDCEKEVPTSPYFEVYATQYDYSKLHPLFTLVFYVTNDNERPTKTSPRAIPGRYLGIDPQRNGSIVHLPSANKITTGFHVIFDETQYYSKSKFHRIQFDLTKNSYDTPKKYYRESGDTNSEGQGQSDDQSNPADLPVELPSQLPPSQDPRHGSDTEWSEHHCENSKCLYPRGHDGPHSHEDFPSRSLRPRDVHAAYAECDDARCTLYRLHDGACIDTNFECIQCDEDDEDSDEQSENTNYLSDSELSDADTELGSDDVIEVIYDDVLHHSFIIRDQSTVGKDGQEKPPPSYEKAAQDPEWVTSMQNEHSELLKSKTWIYVSRNDKRVKGRKPTGSRWVYTIKYKRDGSIEKFKSRFVVRGFTQRQGVDYDRAFSATIRATSFRTLLAISAGRKLRMEHFDVTNAFSQAKLDDVDLFVEPPKGFEEWEIINGKKVSKLLHLKQALYGTKQASRLWQATLRDWLIDPEMGFVQNKADPCLYVREVGKSYLVIGVYVDDIIFAHNGHDFKWFEDKFTTRFRAKHLGPIDWFLGMAVDQHDDYSIDVCHEQYVEKCGLKFLTKEQLANPIDHVNPKYFDKLDRADTSFERKQMSNKPYMELIGSILYAAVMSRPDVAVHSSILAKFSADPTVRDFEAGIHLMHYLYSTRKKKMRFSGTVSVPEGLHKFAPDITRNHGFVAYSDSSWGNKYPYPMFGYAVYFYGSLISYASKQLKTIAFSSCEAEYAAASYACKEVEFIRNLCGGLHVELKERLVIAVDNSAAIDVAHNEGASGRTKHFNMAIHYIRDLTRYRRILPAFVVTTLQRADGLTKVLDKSKFLTWVQYVIS